MHVRVRVRVRVHVRVHVHVQVLPHCMPFVERAPTPLRQQRERVEKNLALTSMPYTKKMFSDEEYLASVRAGATGC